MVEDSRQERRIIRQAFGTDCHLVETGPAPGRPGRCEIHLGSGMIGSGATFRGALADALAFTVPGVVKASDLVTTTT